MHQIEKFKIKLTMNAVDVSYAVRKNQRNLF